MNETLYNIPLHRQAAYRDCNRLIRTHEPNALVATLAVADDEHLIAVQLLSLDTDSEALNAWAPGLPVELMLSDPAREYPLLYRHTNLLDNHPIRAVIPVRPGFINAVKVAVSLDFAVRLAVEQPDSALIEELLAALEFYLHQPTVAQPIEFFHSTLLGFYHEDPLPLWVVLEEEPWSLRYVTDEGVETRYGRLAGAALMAEITAADEPAVWIRRVLAAAPDCRNCEFLRSCGGYFKWPRRDYDCTSVKRLFGQLQAVALELRHDLEAAPKQGPIPPVTG